VTAVLGTVFAIKAVRGFKVARIEAARAEGGPGRRDVPAPGPPADADPGRRPACFATAAASLRDFYLDRAHQLVATAEQGRKATVQAATTDTDTARQRARPRPRRTFPGYR